MTKSYLNVQKEGGERKRVEKFEGWVETKGEEGSTALPLGISIDFFSTISINLGFLFHTISGDIFKIQVNLALRDMV